MSDYLRLPVTQRLAHWRKLKAAPALCGYPHPSHPGEFIRTPILEPNGVGAVFLIGTTRCQWVENPDLRRVGFADEIIPLMHRGWFVSAVFPDEVARGEVYRLTGERYLAAIADPFNKGPCILCVHEVFDTPEDAARCADSIAERYAEDEREYHAKQCAEMKAEDDAREASERTEWEARNVVTVAEVSHA